MPGTGIPNTLILDLINHSLAHFRKRGTFEAEFDFTEYVFNDFWLSRNAYKMQSGKQIERRVIFDNNGSFRFVHKFEVTPRPYVDLVQVITQPWCYAECKAVYEMRTMNEMSGEAELYDYLKGIYFAARMSAVNGLERACIGAPADASDAKTPHGLFWWLNYLNTGTTNYTGGFEGRTALYATTGSSTSPGGLSTTTYPKWRNWVFNHTGINMTTLRRMREAYIKSGFKPPSDIAKYYSMPARKLKIYSGQQMLLDYLDLLNTTKGPDSRNADMSPFQGATTFHGIEWVGVPALDEKTHKEIAAVDLSMFYPVVNSEFWDKQTEPMFDQDQPHVRTVQWDFQFNFMADSKRKIGFLGHEAF